jgi:dTDP-4-dehydrorhamnose 3,5-epimerase
MRITETRLPGVCLIEPARHGDERGFFSETWNRRAFVAAGIDGDFVQDNHSRTAEPFTLRGLHFQLPPHAQGKLVRVSRGRVLDVAVDLRHGSPHHGRHVAVELSAAAWNQLWVPAGFAHGFLTLEPDCEVLYKVTGYYAPAAERGLRFDDPALGIAWPVAPDRVRVNARDRGFPTLAELPADLFQELAG